MVVIQNINELKKQIAQNQIVFLYISKPNCSVCHSLYPQITSLLKKYSNIYAIHIDISDIPEIAGEYLIFSVPAILLFIHGREVMRKARFVPLKELESELEKFTHLTYE